MPQFHDRVSIADGIRFTDDGYLVGDARVARSGIQVYTGAEVGRPELETVRVFRPPEEVFARDAMHSYAHRPITVDHPAEPVSAANWRDLAAGQTGEEVVRDGEAVRVPMVLMDQAAIDAFHAGRRELSMGYTADLDFVDGGGKTPDGEPFDAVQRNLRMNHLALVARARGGSSLRLGDDDPKPDNGGTPMPQDIQTRTIQVDGLSVETTDQGAQAIERLQNDVATARQDLENAEKAHADALQAKDAELAKKDAELDDLKAKVLDDAELDRRVRARGDLIGRARRIADQDYSGKSETEIRKAAVAAVLGDEAVADKGDAYIEARFDILDEQAAEGNGADSIRSSLAGVTRDGGNNAPDPQDRYEDRLTDAWRTGGMVAESKAQG